MIVNNRQIGKEYEEKAAEYLVSKGMRIIERNFSYRRGEIDIIALDGDTLVFVEVKYRKDASRGYALEAVNHRKRHQIIKTAEYYMAKNKRIPGQTGVRFDCIGITGNILEYIKSAFDTNF